MPFSPLPLTEETLVVLLNEAAERPGLDYKRECDLADAAHRIELAKDIGAMMIHGGYIVIGADDYGRPTGLVTPQHARLFDQATVHAKLGKYLADGFDLRSSEVSLDEQLFGLICVLPHPDGWAPFKADGNYTDGKGKQQTAFRAGEVFSRHGSRSEPWSHEDVRAIREEVRRQERAAARAELQEVFLAAQATGSRAQQVATAPAATLTWQLDPAVLTDAIVEQIRVGDDIPLISLLKTSRREADGLLISGASDQFDGLLDGLVCVIARLILVERPALAARGIAALRDIYNGTFDERGMQRVKLGIAAPDVRLRLVVRVLALGALATRERQWPTAKLLALQPVADYDASYWQNWLFHGKVSAARANLLNDGTGHGKSPLVFAQEQISRLACLRPDLADGNEAIMTSLCQFDMLAAFAAEAAPHSSDQSFLANFSQWFAARTDPVLVELIDGGDMRDTIFPHDDRMLADAARGVAYNASRMAHFIHGWHGYEDPRITAFLADHPATTQDT